MEIESEIKDIYMDWYLQISSVKDAYQAGNLPLEDALEELTLPEIFARSPLYEDWRIYHHDQKIRQREEDGFI